MRAIVKDFTLSSIRSAIEAANRAVTSLESWRSSGVILDDTEKIDKPVEGLLGYNRSTAKAARFDGNAWVDL